MHLIISAAAWRGLVRLRRKPTVTNKTNDQIITGLAGEST